MNAKSGALLCAVLMVGCKSDPDADNKTPPGQIDLSWIVGPSGCADADVTDVGIEIDGAAAVLHRCEEETALVGQIDPGLHDLVLIGLDGAGNERYAGSLDEIYVFSGKATPAPTVILAALHATAKVSWFFGNGRLCAQNGAEKVDVALFDDGYLLDSRVVSCDLGSTKLRGLQSGDYVIDVLARDDLGVVAWSGEAEITLDKGDVGSVEVELIAQ